MQLVPVDPKDFPDFREGRRGRVSYPLLKTFLETGEPLVMLDRTGMQQSLQSLTSSLGAYIRGHNLPIKMLTRGGQIYLARTDIDEKTKKPTGRKTIEEYRMEPSGVPKPVTAPAITNVVVAKRFATEKGNAAK